MRKLSRAVFSRYTLSAITILLSVMLIFSLVYIASVYSVLIYAALVILDMLVVLSIINREVNPEYKLPWLVISLLIPLFGPLLYVIF